MGQLVKWQILSELGLLNDQIIAAFHAQKRAAGGPAEQEAASGPCNAEIDRVIEENDLAAVVEEVFAAVATPAADAFE